MKYIIIERTILNKRTSGGHSDPVKIAGQLLGDIGLPPGRKAHCHNQGGTVGHAYWNGKKERAKAASVMC